MLTREQAVKIIKSSSQTPQQLYAVLSRFDANSIALAKELAPLTNSLGNVYQLQGAAYTLLTPAQQRADYQAAVNELASVTSK